MAQVVLEHVTKTFSTGIRAVSDFNLQVESGEFVVLVGPSGSGKTTLLRMIAGLDAPTSGTIKIGSRVVNRLPPRDRNVAMVFQDPALYPHLDAFDNMAFSLAMRKIPKAAIRHKVLEAAELLGITPLLDRKPRQLSGGQARRVALGRALVRRPDCFLFDEPLSGLDAPLRAELRTELKQLQARLGITAIYVTHDQEEAVTLGRRIVVLRDGAIQQLGSPLDVYRQPRTSFVARFLGSPPMNMLDGTIVRSDGRLWFDDGRERLRVPDSAAERMSSRVGKRTTLGVRPEAVALRPYAGQTDNALHAVLSVVEPLGDRTDVHFTSERHGKIVARVDSRDAQGSPLAADGQAAETDEAERELLIYIDLDRVHFFDDEASGGESLCRLY